MNKTTLLNMGVKEDKIKEFQAAYWADVHKSAHKEAKEMADKDRHTASELVYAIKSILRLLDKDSLKIVLAVAMDQFFEECEGLEEPGASEPVGGVSYVDDGGVK